MTQLLTNEISQKPYSEEVSAEMKKLNTELCTNKGKEPCNKCYIPLTEFITMKYIDLKLILGLLKSILKPIIFTNRSVYLPQCYIQCNSNIVINYEHIGVYFKVTTDISFCKSILYNWLSEQHPNELYDRKITELMDVFDETNTISGLVSVLDVLYINYNIWIQS